MILLGLLIATAVFALALVIFLERKSLSSLPGPFVFPLVGNIPQLILHHHHILDYFVTCSKHYGLVFQSKLPGQPLAIFVNDPAGVEHLLIKNFHNYVRGEAITEKMSALFGQGIFMVNDDHWRFQRLTASRLFKNSTLRYMCSIFNRHGEVVIDRLLESEEKKTGIDVQDLFLRFTFDSIGEIGFGTKFDSLHRQDVPFAIAFDNAQYLIDERFYDIFWAYRKDEKLNESLKLLSDFAQELINQRRQEPLHLLQHSNDLLSMFLSVRTTPTPQDNNNNNNNNNNNSKETSTTEEEGGGGEEEEEEGEEEERGGGGAAASTKNGDELSSEYLKDIVINFMIAGRDTTALTLTWAVYLLSQHPEQEQKMMEEIQSKLGGKEPDFDNVKDLPYMKAVIDETLRLYPPVPLDPKVSLKDDILPDGSFIPANSIVVWSAFVLGRTEKFWGEDVLSFRPERWLADKFRPVPNSFIPFQAGPRTCLGLRMAYLEVKILLCKIYQKMRLRLAPDHQIKLRKAIVLSSTSGMKMTALPL